MLRRYLSKVEGVARNITPEAVTCVSKSATHPKVAEAITFGSGGLSSASSRRIDQSTFDS